MVGGAGASAATLAAVARTLSSLLGPACQLKYVEGNGTSSVLRVLNALSIDHPVMTLLIEACESLDTMHGGGSAALACLTADMAVAATNCCPNGVGLTLVLRALRAAIQHARNALLTIALPPSAQPTVSCSIGRPQSAPHWHQLVASLAHGGSHEMYLAAQCASVLGGERWHSSRAVHVQRLIGSPAHCSGVWRGMICPLDGHQASTAQAVFCSSRMRHVPSADRAGLPNDVAAQHGVLGSAACSTSHGNYKCFYAKTVLVQTDILSSVAGKMHVQGELLASGARWSSDCEGCALDGALLMARALRRLGVSLVLCCGGAPSWLVARLAEENVLLVSSISPSAFHTLCQIHQIEPLRDVRALMRLLSPNATSNGVPGALPCALRLRGCLLQGSLANGASARGNTCASASACFLHVRAVALHVARQTCADVAVVLACGPTEAAASSTASRVRRGIHLLKSVSEGIVPGGGAAEMVCAATIERAAEGIAESSVADYAVVPRLTAARQLACDSQARHRVHTRHGCHVMSTALRELICRRAWNTGTRESDNAMAVMRSGNALQPADVAALGAATRHAPLLPEDGHDPIDAIEHKMAILSSSVELLEQVLMSDMSNGTGALLMRAAQHPLPGAN